MESTLKRTWAEIDLDALAYNYRALRQRVGENVKFLGVVKADAYGHGAVRCPARCRPWERTIWPCPASMRDRKSVGRERVC